MELKVNYIYNALIKRVVDGDTVDVEIDLGFKLHTTQRLRLARINAPELKSPIEEEREKAKSAAVFLESLCLNKQVLIQTKKSDLYGRYIAEIFVNDVNINDLMVSHGLAVHYGEGK